MKTLCKYGLMMVLVAGAFGMVACSDDDDEVVYDLTELTNSEVYAKLVGTWTFKCTSQEWGVDVSGVSYRHTDVSTGKWLFDVEGFQIITYDGEEDDPVPMFGDEEEEPTEVAAVRLFEKDGKWYIHGDEDDYEIVKLTSKKFTFHTVGMYTDESCEEHWDTTIEGTRVK